MKSSTTTTPPDSSTTNPPDEGERLAFLALALVEGLGARRIAQLLSRFGSATQFFATSNPSYDGIRGIAPQLRLLLRQPRLQQATDLLKRCDALGYHVVIPADTAYPLMLRSIPDPPALLFGIGRIELANVEAVAIVGSRNHTRYGGEVAAQLGEVAARAGLTVVSGMARGLDAVAQLASHRAGGTSIGVLGTGIDQVYPKENRELFELVARDGLLLSEFPPGAEAHRGSFPQRNRLISGLARALVVVEAAENSGTLITVGTALDQGRDVLVVPGPIDAPTSRGTNRLLRDGAVPILELSDMLVPYGRQPVPKQAAPIPVAPPCTLSPTESRVFSALTGEGQSVDDLAELIGIPVGELLAALLGLELGGIAQQLPGALYRKKPR